MEINKHNKLLALWQSLSKQEKRSLKPFLQSPYYTRREDVFRLYAFLRKQKKKKSEGISKELVFQNVFPGQIYDDLKLRATMSDLQELIETFLLDQMQGQQAIYQHLQLAQLYRKRQLDKHYKWTQKKLDRQLTKYAWRDESYYQYQLDRQVESMQYYSAKRRTGELPLQQISDSIDLVYLIRKLRHACTQLSHQAVYQTSYDFGLLPLLIDQIPASPYFQVPTVAIFYHCYCFLTERNSIDHFRAFSALFYREAAHFPPSERKDLCLQALNFCIRLHNSGDMVFTREAWQLYQFALKEGLLLESGQLSRFAFNNIVGIAIKLEELSWTEQFIDTYQSYIAEAYRESSVNLNRARLSFAQGAYEDALPYLQGVNRKDMLNNLIARMLLIKIFYHTDAHTGLYAQLDSLDKLLRRKDVNPYHRRNFGNIIRFLRRLLALAPYDKAAKKELRQDMKACPELSEKEWLLGLLLR